MTATTALAYIHPGEVSNSFAYCTMRTMVYEMAQGRVPPAVISQRCGSGQLVEARNETVAYFLDSTPCEWLWFVDSDMGFDYDTLEQLICSADPDERPVVGALCFGLKKNGEEDAALQATRFHQFPTVYVWREKADEVGFQVVPDYPRDAMVECSASGAACFVAHRSALEAIRAKHGDHWFTKITHPVPEPHGTTFSEDLSFFVRLASCDLPMFVNTAIKTSHDKRGVFLTEETWDAQQALIELAGTKPDPLEFDTWIEQQPA